MTIRLALLTPLALATVFSGPAADAQAPKSANYAGFMYTSTNADAGNGIIALGRRANGSVIELPGSPYLTGHGGDAAEGDFDTQWALRLVGNYLLAVNAGANPINGSVSVFRVNRTTGSLVQIDQDPTTPQMDNMDSRGIRAASVASLTQRGTTWIVVGNQHSGPLYEGDPPKAVGKIRTSPLRNLALFTLDPETGILRFRNIGVTYDSGEAGGPITVEFNPAGTKLSVSTVGVSHIAVPDTDLKLQKPGRVYIYNFAVGKLSRTGVYEEAGISGNTGTSWSPKGRYIYSTNANLNSSKEANGVTVHDGTTAAKVQNFATGDRNDEVCWTLISHDGTKLYTASFQTNGVSVFDIGADDRLTQSLKNNFFPPAAEIPPLDSKDLYESRDGYLYLLGAQQSHAITTFKTSSSGALERVGSPYYIPTSEGKTAHQHAYLGLTGFDR